MDLVVRFPIRQQDLKVLLRLDVQCQHQNISVSAMELLQSCTKPLIKFYRGVPGFATVIVVFETVGLQILVC